MAERNNNILNVLKITCSQYVSLSLSLLFFLSIVWSLIVIYLRCYVRSQIIRNELLD